MKYRIIPKTPYWRLLEASTTEASLEHVCPHIIFFNHIRCERESGVIGKRVNTHGHKEFRNLATVAVDLAMRSQCEQWLTGRISEENQCQGWVCLSRNESGYSYSRLASTSAWISSTSPSPIWTLQFEQASLTASPVWPWQKHRRK